MKILNWQLLNETHRSNCECNEELMTIVTKLLDLHSQMVTYQHAALHNEINFVVFDLLIYNITINNNNYKSILIKN